MERTHLSLIVALALGIPAAGAARNLAVAREAVEAPAPSIAFARYIAALRQPNPFGQSEPVAIVIEGSLPGLYKQSRVTALRKTDESGHSEYLVMSVEGDDTVIQEVIAPLMAFQERIESLPASSVAITPANYRFRYVGQLGHGDTSAYVFRITPKKKRDGMIQGELWIDSVTGVGTLQSGQLVKSPSPFISQTKIVCDTTLLDGVPAVRVTHVATETRLAGRGELTITEARLPQLDNEPTSPRRLPGDVSMR